MTIAIEEHEPRPSRPAPPPIPNAIRVRVMLPVVSHHRLVIASPRGDAVSVEWIFTCASRWARMDESLPASGWHATRVGPFVMALRGRW